MLGGRLSATQQQRRRQSSRQADGGARLLPQQFAAPQGKLQGSGFGKFSVLANEETADADFAGVGLDQQCDMGRQGEKAIEKFQVFRCKRESIAGVAAKISHRVRRGRNGGLEPPPAIL